MASVDDGGGLSREVRRLADGVSRLVREHVDLARAELREDARRIASDAAMAAAALPFLLAAHLLLSVAVALWLAPRIGSGWAFAAVGGLNLVVGGALGLAGLARLRRQGKPQMTGSREELQQSKELLRALRQPATGNGADLATPSQRSTFGPP